MKRLLILTLLVIGVLALGAWTFTNNTATEETTPTIIQDDDEQTVVLEDDIERPDWQLIELTDVVTRETFTLADFYGKTVFVEPMATWCSNCRSQLRNVAAARTAFMEEGVEDVVFIGLSVEINLDDSRLADYQENQGFDWPFAIIDEEMLVALVEEFGRSVSNPPSTPHFVIRADGTYTDITTGIESPEEIQEQILQAIEDSAPTLIIEDEIEDETETSTEEEAVTLDIERRPWQLIELTDVATGETFTLADFDGQTVFVEPMATWCSNCRAQLQSVSAAQTELDADDVVFIALSLETNLDDDDLADYATQYGFDMTFAVMNEDFLVALIEDFGRSASNAPSSPHFIIAPDGSISDIETGFESTEEIIEQINAARGT